ncbi:MAG TPA: hypothetical protein VJQ25_01740, partial [Nitrospira sp.]|nr:hypothetical protein [Nitrospira sp.]
GFAERSIVILENTLGERHPETAQSLEMMIKLMWTTHREREAQILEARLHTIRQRPSSNSESADEVDHNDDKDPAH